MSSDSSPTATPMVLTPESTGSPDSASLAAAKKARRQTAFYPNVNSSNKPQKPFSRSAAKRESVMALGSIEHLQHYFTKTGIAAKKNPLSGKHSGLVPAIGGKTHIRTNPSLDSLPEFALPPSPMAPVPPHPTFPPFVKTYETNPESLLPGVVEDLTSVARTWCIDDQPLSNSNRPDPNFLSPTSRASGPVFDVLGVLKTTTRAIRSIRNYVLSLPDESTGTLRAQFRSKLLAAAPVPKRLVSQQKDTSSDPLTLIRRSALDVLTVLRALEEKSRVPLSDDAYDTQSDRGGGSHSRIESPSSHSDELPPEEHRDAEGEHDVDPDSSVVFSLVQVHGRYESVPVWEDENAGFEMEEGEREKKEYWDERLVLGSGWLYKQDVTIAELGKEQEVVGRYLDVVDEVLFGGREQGKGKRGWERHKDRAVEKEIRGSVRAKNRRVSSGDGTGGILLNPEDGKRRVVSMGMIESMRGIHMSDEPEEMDAVEEENEEVVDDEELPDWAKRSNFINDELGRSHAILSTFLPSQLLSSLPPPSPRLPFLASLSSGQLLCAAYNACVRKSRKPWGYVSPDAIHDILALEMAEMDGQTPTERDASKGKGWTFRRTDNLRLWAGALKLRYMLPVITPPAKPGPESAGALLASPSKLRFPSFDLPIMFDAKVVAKRDDGWDEMLESLLKRWVMKVVEERRGEH